jgi:D-alanyl-D-alanine endopeptidase (penicillin-binding protein 7)
MKSLVVAAISMIGAVCATAHADALPMPSGAPDVRSASVLIVDEAGSKVLYSRHADVATPIASITKLMTALVVLDSGLSPDETLEITKADLSAVKGAPSRLPVGARVSRGDLLHIALMSSDNRAAHALGRNYPGGLPDFVDAMNAKARTLQMHTAHFSDPTGLSSKNVASPYDLAELVVAASRYPLIRDFSTDRAYTVRIGRSFLEFRNTNNLVAHDDWNIIVQKTGYIAEAGRCLVMKAVIRQRPVVIVLLDSFGKYTRTADARRVRRWIESTIETAPDSALAGMPAAVGSN